jgi:multicomponent Na+:H+ antiporter subunit G
LIYDILSVILMGMGLFLFASGTLGLIRLPDFYCRMHATGKCDTLGALLALLVANPTATHAIGRAALVNNVAPWTKEPGESVPEEKKR